MSYFWCYRGEPRRFPRDIEITKAETIAEACATFDMPFPSPFVHQLTSPKLQRLADKLAPGCSGLVHVERMPSARDWAVERGYG